VLAEVARREAARAEVVVSRIEDEEQRQEILGRSNCTLSTVGRDELWLFGGERREGDGCRVYGELYRWRVDKNDWAQISSPNSPAPRCSHQACEVAASKLYIFGGEYATLTQFRHFNDLWLFDCKKMQWEKRGQGKIGPSPRSGHRAMSWRGQYLLFGGFFKRHDSESIWFNDIWIYTPSRDEWTEIITSTIPGAVRPPGRSACVLGIAPNDLLCIWGGYSEVKCDTALKAKGKHHTDSWQLDLSIFINSPTDFSSSSLRWERLALKGESPSPRSGMRAAGTKPDLLYVFGGVHDDDFDKSSKPSTFFNQVFVLDFANRRWYHSPFTDPAPAPRLGAAVAFRASLLYIAGGTLETRGDREHAFDDLWTYDVKLRNWKCLITPSVLEEDDVIQDEEEEEEEHSEDTNDSDDNENTTRNTEETEPPRDVVEDEMKDEDVIPLTNETLRDFFDRTREYWLSQSNLPPNTSTKDLKRAAFQLASEAFEAHNIQT